MLSFITNHYRPKNALQFGKAVEYAVFSKLIMSGGEVYIPAVDDNGVDILVKRPDGRYVEIQIKAISNNSKDPGLFAAIRHKNRPNYWFIFYSEPLSKVWVMNSDEFTANASQNPGSCKNPYLYSINFGKHGTRHSDFLTTDFSRILY